MFGKKDVKKDKKTEKNEKHDMKSLKAINFFIIIVVAMIIISFLFYDNDPNTTPLTGITNFFRSLNKQKKANEDGSFSIPEDAYIDGNSGPDKYIGMVLGEKITYGKNDWFNQQIKNIKEDPRIPEYFRYSYAKMIFGMAINRIIAIYNAKKVGIVISDKYKIDEVASRYYIDRDGDINYDAMKENEAQVTMLADEMKNTLLFENISNDCFNGLPLSNKELWNFYVLDNVKLSVKYINISNNDIEKDKLESFLSANKSSYMKYKLAKIVFDAEKTQIADEALKEILKDVSKFDDVAKSLKDNNKIINIIKENDYIYFNDIEENDLKELIKNMSIGAVGEKVIKTKDTLIIFKVIDIISPLLDDNDTYEKVKSDYSKKNYIEIDKKNQETADQIYNYAKTNGIENAAARFNKKLEKSDQLLFLESFPLLNMDNTDDAEYAAQVFKLPRSSTEITKPHKYESGYIITGVIDKKDINLDDFINKFDGYAERYSNKKSNGLEEDYYNNEKKKYEVIDNFDYVNLEIFLK